MDERISLEAEGHALKSSIYLSYAELCVTFGLFLNGYRLLICAKQEADMAVEIYKKTKNCRALVK